MTTLVSVAGESNVNRRIFRAVAAVAGAGIMVKVAGTCKEMVLAGIYGRSDVMDAFLIALLIPSLLINVIAESMNQALIPALIRVRLNHGRASAQELFSSSLLSMCVILAGSCAAMGLSAHIFFRLLASNFSAPKLALAIHLFYVLLPLVLVSGIATNCAFVLNSLEEFAYPAAAPLVISVTIMAGTLAFHGRFGIWALVWSTLLGSAINLAVLIPMMRAHGYRIELRWYGQAHAGREVAGQYLPILLSGIVASGGLLVDQAMAARLHAGSVTALVLAGRFVGVVSTLLAGAVSSAVVPYFSAMIVRRDWKGCKHTLRTWAVLMGVISVPIALGTIVIAPVLVRITLQRGAFNLHDTRVVAPVLAMYAIQIPFYVVSRVYYRFIVAMRRTDLVLYCGALNLVLDVVLNIVLMRWLGLPGIALATSIWTMSTLAFLWFWTRRLLAVAEQAPGEGGAWLGWQSAPRDQLL